MVENIDQANIRSNCGGWHEFYRQQPCADIQQAAVSGLATAGTRTVRDISEVYQEIHVPLEYLLEQWGLESHTEINIGVHRIIECITDKDGGLGGPADECRCE